MATAPVTDAPTGPVPAAPASRVLPVLLPPVGVSVAAIALTAALGHAMVGLMIAAAGAKGEPPRPPRAVSKRRTPRPIPVHALTSAVPMCERTDHCRSAVGRQRCAIRSR